MTSGVPIRLVVAIEGERLKLDCGHWLAAPPWGARLGEEFGCAHCYLENNQPERPKE
jgi:hypothetical protein